MPLRLSQPAEQGQRRSTSTGIPGHGSGVWSELCGHQVLSESRNKAESQQPEECVQKAASSPKTGLPTNQSQEADGQSTEEATCRPLSLMHSCWA